jgi:hypothetical protein
LSKFDPLKPENGFENFCNWNNGNRRMECYSNINEIKTKASWLSSYSKSQHHKMMTWWNKNKNSFI